MKIDEFCKVTEFTDVKEDNDKGYSLCFDRYDEIKKALSNGLIMVESDPYTIQIDIDSQEDYDIFNNNYEVLNRYQGEIPKFTIVKDVPSKSGGEKRHITLKTIIPLDIFERIALQTILGSDRTREMMNYIRVKYKIKPEIILFEVKS